MVSHWRMIWARVPGVLVVMVAWMATWRGSCRCPVRHHLRRTAGPRDRSPHQRSTGPGLGYLPPGHALSAEIPRHPGPGPADRPSGQKRLQRPCRPGRSASARRDYRRSSHGEHHQQVGGRDLRHPAARDPGRRHRQAAPHRSHPVHQLRPGRPSRIRGEHPQVALLGTEVLYGPEVYRLHAPGTGNDYVQIFPWTLALDALEHPSSPDT